MRLTPTQKPLRQTRLPVLVSSQLLIAADSPAARPPTDNPANLRPVAASSFAGFNVSARVVDCRYTTHTAGFSSR